MSCDQLNPNKQINRSLFFLVDFTAASISYESIITIKMSSYIYYNSLLCVPLTLNPHWLYINLN